MSHVSPLLLPQSTTFLRHWHQDEESLLPPLIVHARLICCCSDTIFLTVCSFLNGSKVITYFLKCPPPGSNFLKIHPFKIPVGQLQHKQKKCHSVGSRENIYEGAPFSQSALCPHTILLHPWGRILWKPLRESLERRQCEWHIVTFNRVFRLKDHSSIS